MTCVAVRSELTRLLFLHFLRRRSLLFFLIAPHSFLDLCVLRLFCFVRSRSLGRILVLLPFLPGLPFPILSSFLFLIPRLLWLLSRLIPLLGSFCTLFRLTATPKAKTGATHKAKATKQRLLMPLWAAAHIIHITPQRSLQSFHGLGRKDLRSEIIEERPRTSGSTR